MSVTEKLLKVFEVDKQLRDLRSRLVSAERFLGDQDRELASLTQKRTDLEKQAKQLTAEAANHEGECKRLDERMSQLRSQMDNAQSNKEYKAFLNELNTFKGARDRFETQALEAFGKVDAIKKQIEDLSGRSSEREQMRKVAASDRDARNGEIASRVQELTSERASLAGEVPSDVLSHYERLMAQRGEQAMGPVEIVDAKRHEYNCGVCMMHLPVDAVAGLISKGLITRCASCQCLLYVDEESAKAVRSGGAKVDKAARKLAKDLAPKKRVSKPKTEPLAGKKAKGAKGATVAAGAGADTGADTGASDAG